MASGTKISYLDTLAFPSSPSKKTIDNCRGRRGSLLCAACHLRCATAVTLSHADKMQERTMQSAFRFDIVMSDALARSTSLPFPCTQTPLLPFPPCPLLPAPCSPLSVSLSLSSSLCLYLFSQTAAVSGNLRVVVLKALDLRQAPSGLPSPVVRLRILTNPRLPQTDVRESTLVENTRSPVGLPQNPTPAPHPSLFFPPSSCICPPSLPKPLTPHPSIPPFLLPNPKLQTRLRVTSPEPLNAQSYHRNTTRSSISGCRTPIMLSSRSQS
jgi:hypothetical protein